MKVSFFNRLVVRVWLAVVLAVLVLTFAFGALWRDYTDRVRAERLAEQPARELMVRDANGALLGQASAKAPRPKIPGQQGPGPGLEFEVTMPSGDKLLMQLPPRPAPALGSLPSQRWIDGNTQRNPSFLLWLGGVIALAVAMGSYPIVRRITKRLESLQRGVERWGAGNLKERVATDGADEVAFLGHRFNAAADRIEALVQAHKTLLANASHELRSPLTRIRMGLELSQQAPSPALQAELARSINELDALIDEILLSSRLDAAQHSPGVGLGAIEEVDMIALVAQECARYNVPLDCQLPDAPAQEAQQRQTQNLQMQSLQIQGVPRLLRRLVRNLLENAQRYGRGSVQVMLRPVPHLQKSAPPYPAPTLGHSVPTARNAIEIQVCDRGPGVPVVERARIFEPFYRSSSASQRDGGVGLGLALVQSIAQSHGGSVTCLGRDDGTGACFVVHITGY